jgi:hypothetical protein
MLETWLRPNQRAIWFGCIVPLAVAGLGAWLALAPPGGAAGWRWSGIALAVGALGAIGLLLAQLRQPRIGYRAGCVQFYLRSDGPLEVPVQVVEAFFLGQGPADLPGGASRRQETVTLVARLAQRETEWAHRDVKPALGAWCGGYVTIRGTWCEPLTTDVIRKLNRRLKEVQTELKDEGSRLKNEG